MIKLFKYFIIPIILFFSIPALGFWVLWPLYGDIKVALELKKQNMGNLNDRLILSENLDRLVSKYNERLADIEAFSKVVPEGENIPELLVGLEDLASRSGLTFISVNFKTEDFKEEKFKTLIMELKVKGSYLAFRNYLQNLEHSLRIFDVTSISFSGVGPGQSNVNLDSLDFNLLVNTYYQ